MAWRPMIGGLVTSTGFTLLALPSVYELVHDLGARRPTLARSDQKPICR